MAAMPIRREGNGWGTHYNIMGIMQATEQRRDATLDIAKALCITLMVVGHGGYPSYLGRFIYMFHMPCFFFISGWLLSDKYVLNLKAGLQHKSLLCRGHVRYARYAHPVGRAGSDESLAGNGLRG